ncbi:MAG: glycosyltransferase [Candidatus Pacebacteria bacterium]|nr:glycosyltransferase [Candidatus Paceibacterota bacterium]
MKILYLADAKSIHTKKIVSYFTEKGHEVTVASFQKEEIPNVTVFDLGIKKISPKGGMANWRYLSKRKEFNKLLKKIKPDILHSHYATSYGLLGALSSFHPFIISVWGSDILKFPKKSSLHKKLIKFNFKKADYICSTSQVMAREIKKYTKKKVLLTPFGIDYKKFRPMPELKPKEKIIIGTIKTLEKKYGIHYLIQSFSLLFKKYRNIPLELHIGGGGSLKEELQKLSEKLGIKNKTKFLGNIPHEKVPEIINSFFVSVFLSESESFGVSVLESEACQVPVIVSNVGGLPEVMRDKKTGFIVPKKNPESAAKKIEELILNKNLREIMGKRARDFVIENYNWEENIKIIENLYKKILD